MAFTSAFAHALESRLYRSNNVVCDSAEAPSLRVSFSLSLEAAKREVPSLHPHLSPTLSGAFQLGHPLTLPAKCGGTVLVHLCTSRKQK